MKILVAEDTPTQAAMVKLGLSKLGHEVVLAGDGIDAIGKVYREQPDLIVSDIVMPRLNGYQVCRLVKDDRQTVGIPVILLTSLDQKQDMFWGLKSGADKYITKGGNVIDLVEDIQSFLKEWYEERTPREKAEKNSGKEETLNFDVMERVIKMLDRNLFESTVVSEIQNLVNILDDYGKTITSVLEILSKVIDFHVGCILLGSEDKLEQHLFVNRCVNESFLTTLRDEVVELFFREAAGVKPDLSHEEVYDPHNFLEQPGSHPSDILSLNSNILYTKGEPTGIIALASGERNAFTERALKTFGIISRHANIVIDYARLYERTKQLSITDGLTKVYNHRYFQEQLMKEFSRSRRQETPLSLALMDIDHFKHFNDTYGHQQGDIVLRDLARMLGNQVRASDVLARYGGEEFAVIMPDLESSSTVKVAERLRAAVESHVISEQGAELKVTISMGVATATKDDIGSPAELISAADKALYRAKENGRNRVEW